MLAKQGRAARRLDRQVRTARRLDRQVRTTPEPLAPRLSKQARATRRLDRQARAVRTARRLDRQVRPIRTARRLDRQVRTARRIGKQAPCAQISKSPELYNFTFRRWTDSHFRPPMPRRLHPRLLAARCCLCWWLACRLLPLLASPVYPSKHDIYEGGLVQTWPRLIQTCSRHDPNLAHV